MREPAVVLQLGERRRREGFLAHLDVLSDRADELLHRAEVSLRPQPRADEQPHLLAVEVAIEAVAEVRLDCALLVLKEGVPAW